MIKRLSHSGEKTTGRQPLCLYPVVPASASHIRRVRLYLRKLYRLRLHRDFCDLISIGEKLYFVRNEWSIGTPAMDAIFAKVKRNEDLPHGAADLQSTSCLDVGLSSTL